MRSTTVGSLSQSRMIDAPVCRHSDSCIDMRRERSRRFDVKRHWMSLLRLCTTSSLRRPLWLTVDATAMSEIVVNITSARQSTDERRSSPRQREPLQTSSLQWPEKLPAISRYMTLALQAVVDGVQDPAVAGLPPDLRPALSGQGRRSGERQPSRRPSVVRGRVGPTRVGQAAPFRSSLLRASRYRKPLASVLFPWRDSPK